MRGNWNRKKAEKRLNWECIWRVFGKEEKDIVKADKRGEPDDRGRVSHHYGGRGSEDGADLIECTVPLRVAREKWRGRVSNFKSQFT